MVDNKIVIGVDVGGTNIRSARIRLDKDSYLIEDFYEEKTDSLASEEDFLKQLVDVIRKVFDPSVEGIGVGFPAIVDEEGVVYDTNNIPSLKHYALKDNLEDYFTVPITINNDADCFVMAEKRLLEQATGNEYGSLVGVVIGTGLGSGIFINNNIYVGSSYAAGELGEIPYKDSTFEENLSSRFFNRQNIEAISAYRKAVQGNEDMRKLFKEFGFNLGDLFSTIAFSINPKIIFIGGSLIKARSFFEEEAKLRFKENVPEKVFNNTEIRFSETDSPGILGAAFFIERALKYQ